MLQKIENEITSVISFELSKYNPMKAWGRRTNTLVTITINPPLDHFWMIQILFFEAFNSLSWKILFQCRQLQLALCPWQGAFSISMGEGNLPQQTTQQIRICRVLYVALKPGKVQKNRSKLVKTWSMEQKLIFQNQFSITINFCENLIDSIKIDFDIL